MESQPHVFLIMADHLRFDCLSCYGDLQVNTPHLDALSEESVIFDNAYCATPLCVPTRNAMYTGKTPHTHGAIVNREAGFANVKPEHKTLYECVDQAGYAITHIGVNHCWTEPALKERVPNAYIDERESWREYATGKGIEPNVEVYPEVQDTRVPVLDFDNNKSMVNRFPAPRRILYPHSAEDFMDMYWSRHAARKIAELDVSRPNYVETLFWAPHSPWIVPEPYYSMYPPETIDMPDTVGRWYEGQPASLLLQACAGMGAGSCRRDYYESWSAYLGLVTMIDDCVGRVVEAIKAKGIWDESLVVFTMDHGEMLGEHHVCQKHCHYEPATHIPLLVKPPKHKGLSRRDQSVSAIDYCPTICDYAGAPAPEGCQGVSYRPVVEAKETAWRDRVFMEYNGDFGRNIPSRAVAAQIDGRRWKYIYTYMDKDELYCLDDDPKETKSLVDDPELQEIRMNLRSSIGEWMKSTDDLFEMPAIDAEYPSLGERLRIGL